MNISNKNTPLIMILSKIGYNTWYNLVYLNEEISFDHFWGAKEHHYTYIPALHA